MECLHFTDNPNLISFVTSKKQKTAGAFQEQSIDQLNDVTAVSGVNLRVRISGCYLISVPICASCLYSIATVVLQ
jgi:hypothetical protein